VVEDLWLIDWNFWIEFVLSGVRMLRNWWKGSEIRG